MRTSRSGQRILATLAAGLLALIGAAACSSPQAPAGSKPGAGAPAGAAAPAAKAGDGYPARPITIVTPWGTGGGSDQFTRGLVTAAGKVNPAVKLVVVNMPGAGGLNGLTNVMQQPADGYTVYQMVGDLAQQIATGEAKIQVDDLVPLFASPAGVDMWFIRSDEQRFKDFESLVEYARKNEVTIGINALGGWDDVSISAVEKAKGIKLKKVPFNQPAERYAALAGKHIDLLFEQPGDIKSFLQARQFRPILAVAEKPVKGYEDVPTTMSQKIDLTLYYWRGLAVKKDTPAERVQFLADLFQKAGNTPEYQSFAAGQSYDLLGAAALEQARATALYQEQVKFFARMLEKK